MRRFARNVGRPFVGLMEWCVTFMLWLLTFFTSRFGSDAVAVEAMIVLNIHARQRRNYYDKEWIYELKTKLVQSLYERGYCIRAGKVLQRLQCWGTWNHDCDQFCPKCGGTGIYREIVLYQFTFLVGGRKITWHQPENLVTWPVEETRLEFGLYQDREEKPAPRFNFTTNCFTVWWNLKRHGRAPALPLLKPLRFWKRQSRGFYGNPGDAYGLLAWMRWQDDWWELGWPVVPYWRMPPLGGDGYWYPRWFQIGQHRKDWTVILFGISIGRVIFRVKRWLRASTAGC